ncbi:unnamed protein product [Polarella glacialis]|uniref:ATP-grasp domain-containing protein n=1 Tax=Polarella glacialis TaxID=89957 RepID=A0A813K7R6_POLGL|nr:unnamed protein product [Polarella glacialis]
MSTRPVVLHLCGSAASDYYEGVSVVYATGCLQEIAEHGTYTNVACIVHLDGSWSFPSNMSEEARSSAEHMSIDQAVLKIKELNPSAVVPHMFCLPGMTAFRGFCDVMNIPLVGNPAAVMALSTNKWQTRALVACHGVKVPAAEMVSMGEVPKMQPPFMVKPCNEDNSQGVALVQELSALQSALDDAFQFDHEVLVERYVPLGRELRVAVLEQDDKSLQLLPCIEYFLTEEDPIRTAAHKLVTDQSGKPVGLASGGRKCPADIDEPLREKLRDLATRSHKALGCRDYSLYDVRVDPQGEPYFIEACLYCSFSPQSVVVAMAAHAGQDQRSVFEMLVNRAISRKKAAGTRTVGMKG